jgi:hypothetical protein
MRRSFLFHALLATRESCSSFLKYVCNQHRENFHFYFVAAGTPVQVLYFFRPFHNQYLYLVQVQYGSIVNLCRETYERDIRLIIYSTNIAFQRNGSTCTSTSTRVPGLKKIKSSFFYTGVTKLTLDMMHKH